MISKHPYPNRTPTIYTSKRNHLIGSILFLSLYISIMLWFRCNDVFHNKFDIAGPHYLVYNLIRFLFIPYLMLIFGGAGRFIRNTFFKTTHFTLSNLESFLLDFYTGSACWIVGMYIAGLLGLYYWLPIFILTSISIFYYYKNFSEFSIFNQKMLRGIFCHFNINTLAIILFSLLIISLILATILNSGLSIGSFGYDSSHYLAYYNQVISNHGTAPNDLWYHFWVSKGAGLHFLAVLLLDIQAPQLVSTTFLFIISLTLFSFSRRISRHGTLLGLFAVILLLSAFIASDMTNILHQKLHIATAGLVTSIVWLTILASWQPAESHKSWYILLSLLVCAASIHTPPIAILLCLSLGILWLIEIGKCVASKKGSVFFHFLLPLTAFLTLLTIMSINYLWVGMAEVTPFRLFFNLANQATLSHYYSPYLILLLAELVPKEIGTLNIFNYFSTDIGYIRYLIYSTSLPYELERWLLIFSSISIVTMLISNIRNNFLVILSTLAVTIGSSLLLSIFSSQLESTHRLYFFNFPLLLMVVICIFSILSSALEYIKINASIFIIALCTFFTSYSILHTYDSYINKKGTLKHLPPSPLSFLYGKYSIKDVINSSQFNTNPSCVEIARAAQQHSASTNHGITTPKIWTLSMLMEVGCYNLPNGQINMELSNREASAWHKIVFASPQEAVTELTKNEIHYFYVDLHNANITTDKIINSSLMGCLGFSPLLDPTTISSYFKIVWHDHDKYLLALNTKKGIPITKDFINKWKHKIELTEQPGIGNMKSICNKLRSHYHDHGENWPI